MGELDELAAAQRARMHSPVQQHPRSAAPSSGGAGLVVAPAQSNRRSLTIAALIGIGVVLVAIVIAVVTGGRKGEPGFSVKVDYSGVLVLNENKATLLVKEVLVNGEWTLHPRTSYTVLGGSATGPSLPLGITVGEQAFFGRSHAERYEKTWVFIDFRTNRGDFRWRLKSGFEE